MAETETPPSIDRCITQLDIEKTSWFEAIRSIVVAEQPLVGAAVTARQRRVWTSLVIDWKNG